MRASISSATEPERIASHRYRRRYIAAERFSSLRRVASAFSRDEQVDVTRRGRDGRFDRERASGCHWSSKTGTWRLITSRWL
ncbi:Uncharacterised protein [Mycobacteroides abscessus subsp. abscessus]|nr:Uncharacterised protein [Mycobacteroides abscessus subsp. abscessus]